MDVSIFSIFSARGRGRGSPKRWRGGDDFLLKIPGGGGSPRWVGAGGRGARRVFAGNLEGGGLNIFFFGAEIPTKFTITHKMISEPDFIIFKLFSVIPTL